MKVLWKRSVYADFRAICLKLWDHTRKLVEITVFYELTEVQGSSKSKAVVPISKSKITLGLKRYLTMTFGRKINKNTHWIKSYWTRSFILDCVFSYLDWIKGFTFRISVFCPNAVKYKPGKTSSSVTFHAANFFWIVFNQKEIVQLDQCC